MGRGDTERLAGHTLLAGAAGATPRAEAPTTGTPAHMGETVLGDLAADDAEVTAPTGARHLVAGVHLVVLLDGGYLSHA